MFGGGVSIQELDGGLLTGGWLLGCWSVEGPVWGYG
jgi:hypothetical protein